MDRISDLPEEVLVRIMSLLSTKETVQSCILGKRWRNIWALVPVLKLNFAEWLDRDNVATYEEWKECEDKFMQFVNGVLENRVQSHLDMFQLVSSIEENCSESSDASLEWFDKVASFTPRVIDITLDRHDAFEVPDSIFSCTPLEELKLDILSINFAPLINPGLINLPSLKKLDLYGVDIEDHFTRKLFSGCPAIESLVLDTCTLYFSDIASDVLKKLVLTDCWHDKQIQICCPGLHSLLIVSDTMGGILLNNMMSLVRADFNFEIYHTNGTQKLLREVSNVSSLRLDLQCPQFKELLEGDIHNCKPFKNLRSLEIVNWDIDNAFKLVAFFLKHSPNLHVLSLHLDKIKVIAPDLEDNELNNLGEVIIHREHLEMVQIIKSGAKEVLVNQLIEILYAYVKTIGNLIIT